MIQAKFRHDRLDDWMSKREIESSELAEKTGLTYNYIYLIRQGKRPNISAINVVKIAQALEISVEWLTGVSDNPLGVGTKPPQEEIELLLLYRRLSAERQNDLALIAKAFKASENETK